MMAAGHDLRASERSSHIGGVFNSAALYPNLHFTISNWATAFSDFPNPQRLRRPSAEAYLRYLEDYVRHFELLDHISYHSEVFSAELKTGGRWVLKVRQRSLLGEAIAVLQLQADALIVATGVNQVPKKTPDSLAGFAGQILNSSKYCQAFKDPVKKEKQRVLVVGGGESGADTPAELGDLSPNVTVWLRRPNCIGPRYLNMGSEVEQVQQNKTCDFPASAFLEAATTNRMSAHQNVYANGSFRRFSGPRKSC
jgi:dimethylaniline monooxygenase (N-oxide forming)